MSAEVKDHLLEKIVLKRYSAELRLAHQFYRLLPGDSYHSYSGIWVPPEVKMPFGVDHVYHTVPSSGSRSTGAEVARPAEVDLLSHGGTR